MHGPYVSRVFESRDRAIAFNQFDEIRIVLGRCLQPDGPLSRLEGAGSKKIIDGGEPIFINDHIVVEKGEDIAVRRLDGIVNRRGFPRPYYAQDSKRYRKIFGGVGGEIIGAVIRAIVGYDDFRANRSDIGGAAQTL